MIVSANKAQTGSMASFLAEAGYQTRMADPQETGILNLIQEPPSLVILDWGFLNLSGLAWIRRLKAGDKTSHVPILVMGPEMAEDEFMTALEAGADLCLREKLHPRVLVARVHSLLRRKQPL
jgi:two-component system phosphate regulon response regulator PhoB